MSLDIWLTGAPCVHCGRNDDVVFERHITYNLGEMWRAAGLPFSEPIEGMRAFKLVPVLELAFAELNAHPQRFRAMNPPNGWGTYEDLVDVVRDFLVAAREYPDAIVGCGR